MGKRITSLPGSSLQVKSLWHSEGNLKAGRGNEEVSREVLKDRFDGTWSSAKSNSCHGRGVRTKWFLRPLPTQTFLWFYEEMQRLHLHKDLHPQHLCVPTPLVTCQAAFLPSFRLPLPRGATEKKEPFLKVHNDWTRGSVHNLQQGKFWLNLLR